LHAKALGLTRLVRQPLPPNPALDLRPLRVEQDWVDVEQDRVDFEDQIWPNCFPILFGQRSSAPGRSVATIIACVRSEAVKASRNRQEYEHMLAFNDSSTDPRAEQLHQHYLALAERALQHYALGLTIPTFIHHNAGIVFRVQAPAMGRLYLLKLHTRRGDGTNPSATQLEAGLRWLADVARETDIVVQTPVTTTTGQFVCQLGSDASEPINCSLQYWIEGKVPNGDFTVQQVGQLGALMAKLHVHSQQHPLRQALPARHHDASALATSVQTLRTALDTTLLSAQAYTVIVAAQGQIAARMADLGTRPEVWGAVHGDLHYDNVLLYEDEIRPIDFTELCLAHYLYDIGVTLYHIYHQGPEIRDAFLEGYQLMQRLPEGYLRYIETFITYAALDNIAWNRTIAEQACSALFQRNLQQLVDTFCTQVAKGQPFILS
jgi:Ser/Thr protein kinase RdoA (MazF antagonist)